MFTFKSIMIIINNQWGISKYVIIHIFTSHSFTFICILAVYIQTFVYTQTFALVWTRVHLLSPPPTPQCWLDRGAFCIHLMSSKTCTAHDRKQNRQLSDACKLFWRNCVLPLTLLGLKLGRVCKVCISLHCINRNYV